MTHLKPQPTMAYLVGFGWYVIDSETDRSYWHDLRVDSIDRGMHSGDAGAVSQFAEEWEDAARKASGAG